MKQDVLITPEPETTRYLRSSLTRLSKLTLGYGIRSKKRRTYKKNIKRILKTIVLATVANLGELK